MWVRSPGIVGFRAGYTYKACSSQKHQHHLWILSWNFIGCQLMTSKLGPFSSYGLAYHRTTFSNATNIVDQHVRTKWLRGSAHANIHSCFLWKFMGWMCGPWWLRHRCSNEGLLRFQVIARSICRRLATEIPDTTSTAVSKKKGLFHIGSCTRKLTKSQLFFVSFWRLEQLLWQRGFQKKPSGFYKLFPKQLPWQVATTLKPRKVSELDKCAVPWSLSTIFACTSTTMRR